MAKKLMRPRTRSIAAARQAAHDIAMGLHVLCLGCSQERAAHLSLSPFNHRLAACAGHPAMIKDAAACHLHLQCDRKGWDKVMHLVHGHMSDLQERERDCRPGHCPPAIAGASVPQRHREP